MGTLGDVTVFTVYMGLYASKTCDKALYFSRSVIPHGAEEFLYHVGIYGYRSGALEKFVKLNEAQYESVEKLEQLRATKRRGDSTRLG